MIQNSDNYKTKFIQWDKFASIRSRPRRVFETAELGYCYPIERQPIANHHLVKAKGEKTVKIILLQTAYKFMFDIAHVEINLINKMSTKIYNNEIDFSFSRELKNDMLSIIIDEAYHAYVAIDFIQQVVDATNIKPVYKPDTVELEYAINKHIAKLPLEFRSAFELIAICLGENTLTKELFYMTKHDYLNPFFHQVMSDHMADEGRHSTIFRFILKKLWQDIDEKARVEIGALLPDFISDYLDPALQARFDTHLLTSLGFKQDEIERIVFQTHNKGDQVTLTEINPVAANIIDVLIRCDLFTHDPTLLAFKKKNMMNMGEFNDI